MPLQLELERTPGAVAVSGVYSRELAGVSNAPAGIPQTNSEASPITDPTNYPCGSLAIFTECETGQHHFAKKILCGKEWCPECGEDESQAHNRRIARWLPKFQQISQLGYFVIEFPDKYRKVPGWTYSKKGLRRATGIIVDVLAGKRMGRRGRVGGHFSRGLVRWHWYGDYWGLINGSLAGVDTLLKNFSNNPDWYPYAEAFTGLLGTLTEMGVNSLVIGHNHRTIFFDNPGGGKAYIIDRLVTSFAKRYRLHIKPYSTIKINQHANVAVDGGYIDADQLKEIKAQLCHGLKSPELIVHYSYFDKPGEIYHKLKYITRATFRDYNWDPHMARELFNFRNSRWWGSWKGEAAWTLNSDIEAEADALALGAIDNIGSGICPECGAALKKWSRVVDSGYLVIWGAQEIGNTGYYRIPHHEWNGGELSPAVRLRLDELEARAKEKPSVDVKCIAAREAIRRAFNRRSLYSDN
ncbi:hypothetical protein ACFLXT_04315 [Chloroflexota bacterium]